MNVNGLEFHRSFWDIIMLLEGIRHPSMELYASTIDYVETDGYKHQGFVLRLPNSPACLMISSIGVLAEGQKRPINHEFHQTDNMHLMPRYGSQLLPVSLAVPARKAHLSADLIYYWFTLCMDHKAGEVKNAIGRKYALDLQKQMKTWLNILDEFHKYIKLQD